jgi:TPR repeat protein
MFLITYPIASQGYVPAYVMVGGYYMDGGGGGGGDALRSEVDAFKWFELAAKEGSSDAQCNLGEVRYNVHG